MEKDSLYKDVELRSEEVQEVMGKIPSALVRYGILVLAFILLTIFAGSALFSYPDKINTEFFLMKNYLGG